MAQDFAVNQDTLVYCQPSDVSRYLLKQAQEFKADNNPTEAQIGEFIQDVQDDVDNFTRTAWRERQVTGMWLNVDENSQRLWGAGFKFDLKRRNLKPLDADEDDELLIWNGHEYINYLTQRTEGRNADYWLDYEGGYLYIQTSIMNYSEKAIKITFRYGSETVPTSIRKATAQLVAVAIMTNEDSSFLLSEGGDSRNMPYDPRISRMLASVKNTLATHAEVFVI
jgi:hypothetical protein